jgi:serine/threonine protein kinase
LKTFKLKDGESDFFRSRFLAEGRALARIHHPNIARVFDLGFLPDGTAYFVMDSFLTQTVSRARLGIFGGVTDRITTAVRLSFAKELPIFTARR